MSSANYPFRVINYLASAAADTAVPATPANSGLGTSLVVLKRVDASEIVFALPAGVYDMNANLTLKLANNETAVQPLQAYFVLHAHPPTQRLPLLSMWLTISSVLILI